MSAPRQAMQPGRAWYREPWPWIVMAPPAVAVVAGIATWWIAAHGADGLVAEDYYRQGLAVNRDLAREARARVLGLSAEVTMGGGHLRVRLEGAAPEALFVHLVHRTRAGYDQRLRLARVGGGVYESAMSPLAPGGWRVRIEDPQSTWRIVREGS
jgi:hypothetical protein